MADLQLNYVMQQRQIPVAIRQGKGSPLIVRVPYSEDNRQWLRDGKKTNPVWDKANKEWEIPKSWFNDFVNRCLVRYGRVYVIQPVNDQEKCAPSCWDAKGHECQCSCLGAKHGSRQSGGWFVISDTFAFRWGLSHQACRLITKK